LTQHKPAASAAKMDNRSARYAVTVEVTLPACSADEAAQAVQGFLSEAFARSECVMGSVHVANTVTNTEPPSDDTWHRALDCAGALA
jgi:hypothetical protein